jgi:hypothetical protein
MQKDSWKCVFVNIEVIGTKENAYKTVYLCFHDSTKLHHHIFERILHCSHAFHSSNYPPCRPLCRRVRKGLQHPRRLSRTTSLLLYVSFIFSNSLIMTLREIMLTLYVYQLSSTAITPRHTLIRSAMEREASAAITGCRAGMGYRLCTVPVTDRLVLLDVAG